MGVVAGCRARAAAALVERGRPHRDFIWPIDLYIAFFIAIPMAINVWMTILTRRTQGIYTSNWFFAASAFMTIIVFLVGNLPEWFHLTGLNEAYMTWWFAHNILGLLITPVAAAITYYIIPKITGNPLYSHRVGHLHFWSLVIFYSTPAAHPLMGSPLPEWLKPALGGLLLGLLALVVNGFLVWLTSAVAGALKLPFHITGFVPAFLGAIIVGVVGWLLNVLLKEERR